MAAREVQLQQMRLFATNQNPELIGLEQELNGLRAQPKKTEQSQNLGDGNIQIATSKVPSVEIGSSGRRGRPCFPPS
jgi:hypothetical protein